MKLLLFPFLILMIISLFSMLGLGSTTFAGEFTLYENPNGWYDEDGVLLMYQNYTAANSDGGHVWYVGGVPMWINSSGTYSLYPNADGTTQASHTADISFSTTSSLGLIGLIIGIMALATVAGIRVMGSGVSEESVSAIIKGSALIALWGIFSAMALGLIGTIPASFGYIFYFVLTGFYTMGIINQIGHPGED